MKILVAIPTYNNETTISQVIQEASRIGLDILVVNDGSTDKTLDILKKFSGISVITVEENKGKGNALREAFTRAVRNNYSHLITIDADGQHNPTEIPKFINCIEKDKDCLIIGSRNFSSPDIPFPSRLGRKLSNFAFRLVTGLSLTDTQSGFRAYPLEKFSELVSNKNKYDFEMDMLLKAVSSNIKIKEIKISVQYSKETKKSSKFKPISDSIRIAKSLFSAFLKRNNNNKPNC